MDHEVEADGLLPVDVGIANGELLAVAPPHLHQVALAGALLPEQMRRVKTGDFLLIRTINHSLSTSLVQGLRMKQIPDKEEQVVAVYAPIRLEEEVSDEQICPVGCVAGAGEPGVLTVNTFNLLNN